MCGHHLQVSNTLHFIPYLGLQFLCVVCVQPKACVCCSTAHPPNSVLGKLLKNLSHVSLFFVQLFSEYYILCGPYHCLHVIYTPV